MSDWQPMETAPKDRKIILLFCTLVSCGSWEEGGPSESGNWVSPSYGIVKPTAWREV